jgi:hypothetical protein
MSIISNLITLAIFVVVVALNYPQLVSLYEQHVIGSTITSSSSSASTVILPPATDKEVWLVASGDLRLSGMCVSTIE